MLKKQQKHAKVVQLFEKTQNSKKTLKKNKKYGQMHHFAKKINFCKHMIQNLQKRSGNVRGTFGERSGKSKIAVV